MRQVVPVASSCRIACSACGINNQHDCLTLPCKPLQVHPCPWEEAAEIWSCPLETKDCTTQVAPAMSDLEPTAGGAALEYRSPNRGEVD